MHPAIESFVSDLPSERAAAVATTLGRDIPDDATALGVRWTGGRGVLALDPARLFTLHVHPYEEHPPTLGVTHLGVLHGAMVEETRLLSADGGEFVTGSVALVHGSLPAGRVETEGVALPAESALGLLRRLL